MSNSRHRGYTTILDHLAAHGWITLRSMSALLGYSHPTGVYARQRTKKAIPTILIGGIYRVYKGDVIETLENVSAQDQEMTKAFLSTYRRLLKGES